MGRNVRELGDRLQEIIRVEFSKPILDEVVKDIGLYDLVRMLTICNN